MSGRAKQIWLPKSAQTFAARQARQRFLAGMRVAEEGVKQGARMEENWQKTVASIPFWRRVWIALLIVFGKWGSWKGSGTAEPKQTAAAVAEGANVPG